MAATGDERSGRCDEFDPQDLAELVLDIRRGLGFIRTAQGYGRITLDIEVRKGQISKWEMAPALSRKPGHTMAEA